MARTEYGGARVSAVDRPARRGCRPPRCRPRPGPPAGPHADLHRLGAGGAQFVDHVEHRLRRHPGRGIVDGERHARDRSRPPCRSGSTARPAGPGRSRSRPGRCCRTACSGGQVRCRSATSVFSAASRCCSESSSTSRSAGRAVSSESPDSVCRTWVTIATPEQQAQQHRQRAEHQLRAACGAAAARARAASAGSSCRPCVGVGRLRRRPRSSQAPNNLRRSAAALPKMRMPSTTMIAVDSCVPTPELVADVDDQRGDQHVEHERDRRTPSRRRSSPGRRADRRTPRRARPRRRSAGRAGRTRARWGGRPDPARCRRRVRRFRSCCGSDLISAQSAWRS